MKKLLFLLVGVMLFGASTGIAQVNPPKNLQATVVSSSMMNSVSVMLTWEYSLTATNYNIYKKEGTGADSGKYGKLWMTREGKFVDHGVIFGKKYSYYVTAISNNQESVPSDTVVIEVTQANDIVAKVSGTVFDDTTNAPLGRAKIEFLPASFMSGPPSFEVTDSTGSFNLKLKPGEYFIFTGAEGYAPEFYDNAQTMQQATKVTFKSGDSLSFAIGLKQLVKPNIFSVSGSIKDASGNVQQALVAAIVTNRRLNHSPEPMGHSVMVRTDELGNFKIFAKENDTLVLFINPANHSLLKQYYNNKSTFETADRIVISQDITDINITLASKAVYANSVNGVVVDSASSLPLKAMVYAYQKKTNNRQGSRNFVLSDSLTGSYSLANLEPGTYYLLASARGYRPTFFKYDGTQTHNWKNADSIIVTENGVVNNINFALSKSYAMGNAIVYGNIVDGNGENVEGAVASLIDNNGEVVNSTISDLDGSFVLDGLSSGSYQLVSSVVDYSESEVNDVTLESSNNYLNVDLVLAADGLTSISSDSKIVTDFTLGQNYPNPFNPSTVINYQLPSNSFVTIKVYNVIGKEIATLVNEYQPSGTYAKVFSANGLNSGVYFYMIKAGNFSATKKMILIK
ncbi:MAG: carboxypeptidase regulatory-like domain-containing protein [Ignavibacteriaceae bacterium]